jgi:hypothetical protein
MDSPYRKIILVESGASMQDHMGKLVGNSCFFNSLKAGLMNLDMTYSSLNYNDFLALGGWNKGFKGNMVDTMTHNDKIEKLCRNLGCKLSVFSEVIPGVTNSTIYVPFGIEGPEIRIIRLRGYAHFNLMLWHTDQQILESDRILAEELDKKLKEEQKQISLDEAFAKKEQEKYNKMIKIREFEDRHKQEKEDFKLAKMIEMLL